MGSVLSVPAKQGSHSDGIEGLEGKAAMIAFIFFHAFASTLYTVVKQRERRRNRISVGSSARKKECYNITLLRSGHNWPKGTGERDLKNLDTFYI